jgi:glycosyltransferase involved in cell wall biosynthesis
MTDLLATRSGDGDGTARPLRILTATHFYPPHVGGLEVVAQRVATGLVQRGHDVTVLTSAVPGAPGLTTEHGVRVRRLRVLNRFERHGIPFPVFGPSLLLRAWRAVRAADVVHVHDMLYVSSWVTALLCRTTRTPYVVTQHVGMVEHTSRLVGIVQTLVLRTVGALVLTGAARVLPISPVIEDWTRARVPGVRTRVLRNGIDRTRFRPPRPGEREEVRRLLGLPLDEVLVLYVGRFVPKKGYDVVSRAAGPGYRLVFVGGDRPADVPDDGSRTYLGALDPDLTADVYRACDVFVCASVGEGPMTPMEALLCGAGVVVNADPAMRALGLGGAVEELAVTPDSLRDLLSELAKDPDALEALRARGREVAETIPTWETYLDDFESELVTAAGVRA